MVKPARATTDEGEPTTNTELDGGRMPFLSHLAELRDRVRNAAIAFLVAFLACGFFAKDILAWLRAPLFNIWYQHCDVGERPGCLGHGLVEAGKSWGPPKMIYTGLTQPFWVDMSVALWAGVFVASPLIFHQ